MERTDMMGAWTKIVAHALAEIGADRNGLAAEVAEAYAESRWQRMALYPGVREALGRLRARGLPMALVTNGDRRQQRRKIEQYELAPYFDVIVIEGEFGAGKPDEAVYRHVLGALRVPAAGAWMVGATTSSGTWRRRSGSGSPRPGSMGPAKGCPRAAP
jgi:putative hydrolase of the HAD superfamily